MKALPNVTLISFDDSEFAHRTMVALRHCAKFFQFADVVLVGQSPNGVSGYQAAMWFEVRDIAEHVKTDFALCIHADGYIINPQKWTDGWFQYDFIGAPWPLNPTHQHPGSLAFPNARVGNTGFCLKSKRFIEACRDISNGFPARASRHGEGMAGDVYTSQIRRTDLEAKGMKYAPVEVAADFAWECNIEEFPNGRPDAFGFHSFEGKTVLRL